MANKLLSYTTHDGKRQPTEHPLVGLPWLDTRMGDISLTESGEDLLWYKAKRPLRMATDF